jgi:hypothetical protein
MVTPQPDGLVDYIRAHRCECSECVRNRRDFVGAFYTDQGDTADRRYAVGESRGWSWAERPSRVRPVVACKEPGCDAAVVRTGGSGMPRRYCPPHAARAAVSRRHRASIRARDVEEGRNPTTPSLPGWRDT